MTLTPRAFQSGTFAAIAALMATAVFAQPANIVPSPAAAVPEATPRIGLALSGGGARGFAHIGVLKVLEEMRVPISCVTGTSMGAIVGATYSAGISPKAMQKTVSETDWDQVFNDRPPRTETSIRNKGEDYKTLFAPEFGLKDGSLALPKGLLAGVSVEAYFRALMQQAGGAADIERLPTPFRAVAADITTGEAVVMSSGSVSHAMRASMSIPGVMAPVEREGHLLVDGGIVNNLPIDEARKLCADVVIAVNISTPPLKREEITSALSVSMQLINLLGKSAVDEQIKNLRAGDVLIEPDLAGITAGSFNLADDTIARGESAARAARDKLAAYSVAPEQYAAFQARHAVAARALGTVDEIRFAGLERTNPEVLRSLVQTKPGEPLSEQRIAADLRRIYGRGDFESVNYRILEEPGKRVMLIEPNEKSWGPNYLRFGLGLASDLRGESSFNALVSYRKTWLNRLGGEWQIEGQVGRDNHLFTEFYQPLEERGRYFAAPYAMIGQSSRSVFRDKDRVAIYDVQEGRIGVDAGVVLGTWGEFRAGPLWRRVKADIDTGTPVFPSLQETSAGVRTRLMGDWMDHAWFPRNGHRLVGTAYVADGGMGSDRNYKRVELNAQGAFSFGAHTFNLTGAAGSDLNSGMPAYDAFSLGGPLRLSAYRLGELTGREMAFARLMYYNRRLKLPDLLGSGLYLGGSLEVGRVRGRFDNFGNQDTGTAYSVSVFLAADTFLGPAYFGAGLGRDGRAGLFLMLGSP